MNILHYSLGFPPYRTGGMTKFCMDLMRQQVREGNTVSLLWPGEILLVRKKTYIRRHPKRQGIASYELLNPIPVPYDEGIVNIDLFMQEGSEETYRSFLQKLAPDVIHVHTLMGLHKSLLTAAKKQGIRLVFTAHDFFPICPKVTMFRNGRVCGTAADCAQCAECNLTALSMGRLILLQSRLYKCLKDVPIVKKMRKQHRDNYLRETAAPASNHREASGTVEDYRKLRGFYQSLLQMMDVIHYNSSVTMNTYRAFLQLDSVKEVRIPITHQDIEDFKRKKVFGEKLRISYLGPAGTGKGYFLLQEALDLLWREPVNDRKDFSLNVFFQPAEVPPYMNPHDRYSYDMLGGIMEETDVLIAPSILYETFGFTVLEAMSYGVPVIVSDCVGAKDVIPDGGGIVIADITAEKLAAAIKQLDFQKLCSMNVIIREQAKIPTIASMSNEIAQQCYILTTMENKYDRSGCAEL